jgi:hypothetical protein
MPKEWVNFEMCGRSEIKRSLAVTLGKLMFLSKMPADVLFEL